MRKIRSSQRPIWQHAALRLAHISASCPTNKQAQPPARGETMIDGADTAWLMISSILVLLMTLPALALFLWRAWSRPRTSSRFWCSAWRSPPCVSVLWFAFVYSAGLLRRWSTGWVISMPPSCMQLRATPSIREYAYSRKRLCDVPDDLRGHHAGTDHRRLCRAHPLRAVLLILAPLACDRLCARGALGMGRRLAGRARRDGFRRRHRRPCHRRRFGLW